MFGISPLGWVHTLGSLPAIPLAAYMIARYGRIVPRSIPGAVYFVSMLIGAVTVFLVAHQPVSHAVGVITIVLLLAGYGVGRLPMPGRAAEYIETICLSLTVFLLMLPKRQRNPAPCSGRSSSGYRSEFAAPPWGSSGPSRHAHRRLDDTDRLLAQADAVRRSTTSRAPAGEDHGRPGRSGDRLDHLPRHAADPLRPRRRCARSRGRRVSEGGVPFGAARSLPHSPEPCRPDTLRFHPSWEGQGTCKSAS